jgi:hypothetical protein
VGTGDRQRRHQQQQHRHDAAAPRRPDHRPVQHEPDHGHLGGRLQGGAVGEAEPADRVGDAAADQEVEQAEAKHVPLPLDGRPGQPGGGADRDARVGVEHAAALDRHLLALVVPGPGRRAGGGVGLARVGDHHHGEQHERDREVAEHEGAEAHRAAVARLGWQDAGGTVGKADPAAHGGPVHGFPFT